MPLFGGILEYGEALSFGRSNTLSGPAYEIIKVKPGGFLLILATPKRVLCARLHVQR